MKRILCSFLLLLFFFAAYGAETLKFGVISDVQTEDVPGGTNAVWEALDKAFLKMKAEKVDAILVAGDVGQWNDVAIYRRFRRRYEEIFGENPPAFFVVMGNHDAALRVNGEMRWCRGNDAKQMAEARPLFCRELKLEGVNFHKVLKGYDFIGLSMSIGGFACSDEDVAFLKRELDSAVARDPAKPIFVMAHNRAKDTLFNSGNGDAKLAELLKNYPHAVFFSGHTHYVQEDERMIHQRDFTSVNTGALVRVGLPGPALPYPVKEGKTMMIVSCFPEKIVLRRYQLRDGSEILDHGQPWTLPLPLEKKNFVYEPSRRLAGRKRVAPEFPEGAQISAEWQGGKHPEVVLSGPAAKHPDFVLLYRVLVSRKTEAGFEKCAELISYSDFSSGLNFRSDRLSVKIQSRKPPKKWQAYPFIPGEHYRFEVIPEENFGLQGKPLFAELTIPSTKK